LLKKYSFILSDSRIQIALGKNIKIVDSTTISLFKDILKCVGRKAINGKAGGIKSHSVINADEKVPNLVWFSPATTHDHQFLENSNAMRIPFIYSIRDIMITRLLNILPSKNRFCYSNKRECKV
jgi:hypothetical protein